ncbi:hypothetical protein Patl1_12181 [Pistacia atlantica]|uniref:Uncharacterized protein n=1 Tax=Pistacia atlantica TaxID=434234 RepID=A0ACC1A5V8_9ROSI|nr:hypothetical protein Patl1_12181 [Pistacia atlantica]
MVAAKLDSLYQPFWHFPPLSHFSFCHISKGISSLAMENSRVYLDDC